MTTLTSEGYLLSLDEKDLQNLKCAQFAYRYFLTCLLLPQPSAASCIGPVGLMKGIYRTGKRYNCTIEKVNAVGCAQAVFKGGDARRVSSHSHRFLQRFIPGDGSEANSGDQRIS